MLTAHVPMAFAMEALACSYVVRLAADLSLHKVTFERDSLSVIRKACSPLHNVSAVEWLLLRRLWHVLMSFVCSYSSRLLIFLARVIL